MMNWTRQGLGREVRIRRNYLVVESSDARVSDNAVVIEPQHTHLANFAMVCPIRFRSLASERRQVIR